MTAVAREMPEVAALRDRIAAALYERERPHGAPDWSDAVAADREVFEPMADAVLVALGAPADRAGVLREAAGFLRDAHFRDGLSVQEIGTALRHMADEAQQPEVTTAEDGGDS